MTDEGRRLEEARHPRTPGKKWGPYLSERQWGTVREDLRLRGRRVHVTTARGTLIGQPGDRP